MIKIGNILILENSDLASKSKKIEMDDLKMPNLNYESYFKMLKSDYVVFVDNNSSKYKILKNRYGVTTEISNEISNVIKYYQRRNKINKLYK